MLIPKTPVEAILNGSVTTARMPLSRWTPKSRETIRVARLHRNQDGQIIRRTSGERLCRLKVTRHTIIDLERTTNRDAKAEGYRDLDELMRSWFDVYGTAWSDTQAWLISFEIDLSEPVRLLRTVAGYTTSTAQALPEEPEAIDPATISRYTLESRQKNQAAKVKQEAAYRDLSLEDKLRMVQQDAQLRIIGRDDLRVIEKRLERIWQKGRAA